MRFARVEKFIEYLKKEEEHERAEFNLEHVGGVFADPIVPAIEEFYQRDKAWIEKRIRENRERYAEELSYQFESTDELEAGQYDEGEESGTPASAPCRLLVGPSKWRENLVSGGRNAIASAARPRRQCGIERSLGASVRC